MNNCKHNIRIGDLCADCGEIVKDKSRLYNALHSTDDLRVTESMAILQDTLRIEGLRKEKKLVLVLDLDQTVLHTTTSREYLEGVDNFILEGVTYNVKVRPFLNVLLEKVYALFEIHVYTMGTKKYAEKICRIIDPLKKYFGDRIISRSVNNGEYVKNLNRIFCLHQYIVVLDDRADVWNYSTNLLLIKLFFYWKTGDLNDPTVLQGGRVGDRIIKIDMEDNVLLGVTDILLEIHKEFYKENHSDVRNILKKIKNIFKGKKFYLEKTDLIRNLILMHGGEVVKRVDCDIVVRGELIEGPKGTKGIPVVSSEFILNSIYKLEFLPLDFYILEVLEDSEIEEILNDLEGDLFG